MRNSEGFTLIELMIVVVILAVLATISIPNFIKLQVRAKEAKVKGAAHTVQLVTEDYAVRSGGVYSANAVDIQPLLPNDVNNGRILQNAFTSAWTEPLMPGVAATSGQIGIMTVLDLTGTPSGYTINGWGEQGEVIVLDNGF